LCGRYFQPLLGYGKFPSRWMSGPGLSMRFVAALTCTVMLLCLGIPPGYADKRVALVIGNAAYQNTAPLGNPVNDADDMAAALRGVGFEVLLERNADKRSLELALTRFARAAQGADVALFYYAGHGLQYRGLNYLMPVDARLEDEVSVSYELARIEDVTFALSGARDVKIVILDSCRNNPLADRLGLRATRDGMLNRGLARIDAPRGTIIAYAAQPNQVAVDGDGRNSPFTRALIKELERPGLEIATLFRRVAVNVDRATGGRQLPELAISMSGEFYLNTRETDAQAWVRVRESANLADLQDFVRQYPQSFLVADARTRIAALEREQSVQELMRRQLREQAERERAESERRAREQAERDRRDQERMAREVAAQLAKIEEERVRRERTERERAELERRAGEQAERDRLDRERMAREAAAAQLGKIEEERARRDQAQRERAETDIEQAKRDRLEQEKAAREAAARLAKSEGDRRLQERVERERAELESRAREEAKRKADLAAALEKAKGEAKTQIAMLPPPQEPSIVLPSAPSELSGGALIVEIKKELKRLGCFAGRVDDKWMTANTKASVQKFIKYAKLPLPADEPAQSFLDAVRAQPERVCPLECGAREAERNGRCVAKACAAGERLNRDGDCVARPEPKPARHAIVDMAPRQPSIGALPPCGSRFCLHRRWMMEHPVLQ
jgi:uncharacterized caspase-like protein